MGSDETGSARDQIVDQRSSSLVLIQGTSLRAESADASPFRSSRHAIHPAIVPNHPSPLLFSVWMSDEKPDSPSPSLPPLQPVNVLRAGLRWGLVLWALALVLYFEHREGLFPTVYLKPAVIGRDDAGRVVRAPDPTGKWLEEHGMARVASLRPEPPPHAGAFVEVLQGLAGKGGGYAPNWDSAPWKFLGYAALAGCLYLILGHFLLMHFAIYPTPLARFALAFAMGAGAAGVAFELLTLAGGLRREFVWATWAILILGTAGLLAWRKREALFGPPPPGGFVSDPELQLSAQRWHQLSIARPRGRWHRFHLICSVALITLISLIVTLHAVGQPETYWDSLILYIGYARKIFLEQSFPTKVVGQVGIGLGANYPHLFEVLAAQTAAMAGEWHDVVAQLFAPVAGIICTLLVYVTALEISRDRPTALSLALLFRAVPHSIIYFQYASSYSAALLFTAAFVYLAWKYIADGLPGYRDLMLLTAAFAVHVNYLMWLLWGVAAVVILANHIAVKRPTLSSVWTGEVVDLPEGAMEILPPEHVSLRYRPTIAQLLRTRRFWAGIAVALAIASPWYIRNTVVTGNPVYAFYSNVFTASRNVNPLVMRSAEQEWLLNGDGLGRVGRTLSEKLRNSWTYFVTGDQHWKLAPVFVGFVLPGFAVFLGWAGWWLDRRRSEEIPRPTDPADRALFRFGLACTTLFLLLWVYAYVIADFYLYQIVVVLPLFAIFSYFVFRMCDTRLSRAALHAIVLLVGLAPGVIMSLMGFKLRNTGVYEGMPSPQFALTALKKLFMDPKVFYRMEFGGDMEMFDRLRALASDAVLLTHENRHLLMEERLPIVHLDDWEVQQTYNKPAQERLRILDELGITHYLYVPNEDKHVVNSLVGMDELIQLGHFKEIYRSKSSGHSTPELVEHEAIPRDQNVLYERAR